MRTNDHDFLEGLGSSPADSFEGRFLRASTRLGLGDMLGTDEVELLFNTAFQAALCNIAFNGLGGCHGKIKPDNEFHRVTLETEFMEQRDLLFASRGWQMLEEPQRRMIHFVFLSVFVTGDNLAW
jgi:hypothetical protein